MRVTRESLIRIAKETAQERAFNDRDIIAAYLTGSLVSSETDPMLGGTADIDIIFVHAEEPKHRREFVKLTPDFHLDISHRAKAEFKRPRELRLDPAGVDDVRAHGQRHLRRHMAHGRAALQRDGRPAVAGGRRPVRTAVAHAFACGVLAAVAAAARSTPRTLGWLLTASNRCARAPSRSPSPTAERAWRGSKSCSANSA